MGRGVGGCILAPRGAPPDGWVGQWVFVSLLSDPGTGGPRRGPRSSATSFQSVQAYREEGSVTPWKSKARSAGPSAGWASLCCPPENSLGELPYCALESPPGWPGVGRGLCCPRRHPYPRMARLAGGNSVPPPTSGLYTHLVGSFVDPLYPRPFRPTAPFKGSRGFSLGLTSHPS